VLAANRRSLGGGTQGVAVRSFTTAEHEFANLALMPAPPERFSRSPVANASESRTACGDVAVTRTAGVWRYPEGVKRAAAELKPKPDRLACVGGQTLQFDPLPGAFAGDSL